jgi:hypothetical protein
VEQVRLPDLEVIRRYSIAVRREHAPVEEVLEALRADVEAIEREIGGGKRTSSRSSSSRSSSRSRSSRARR